MNHLGSILQSLTEREAELGAEEARLRLKREQLNQAQAAFKILADFIERTSSTNPLNGNLALSITEQVIDYSAIELRKAVENAALTIGMRQAFFSSVDVIDHFERVPEGQRPSYDLDKNRANISTYMKDLAESMIIQEVSPASGRRPANYTLTPAGKLLS